jgi:transcriptional regulator
MYVPSAFAETRTPVLHDFIRRHDFATIVTSGAAGLQVSHVPVVLLPHKGRLGALQFHLAKPNDHAKDLAGGAPALAIFHGPHGYVSPTWYKTKLRVPTWNYVVVHATGTPRVLTENELHEHLDALVAAYESREGGWSTNALPADFAQKLRQAVIGFEMEIQQLQGKWKLGQNRTREDREGAVAGLRATGTHDATTLADWMEQTLKENKQA